MKKIILFLFMLLLIIIAGCIQPGQPLQECQTGYVLVPVNEHNQKYTDNSFCVMKYEAKCDLDGDGKGDDAIGLAEAEVGNGWNFKNSPCPKSNVVSTPEGSVIVHITHTQAVSACPSGSHLIRNNEWMAITRNAEQVASNWADGIIGSTISNGGGLKRGNIGVNDSASYNALTDPDKGTNRNEKAKLALSNGSEIWDISGNAEEHVMLDEFDTLISLEEQPDAINAKGEIRTGYNFTGFNSDDPSSEGRWYLANNGSEPPLGYDAFRPSNPAWNANQGVGRINTCSNCLDAPGEERVLLRGGLWHFYGVEEHVGVAGAFMTGFGIKADYEAPNVGFRCVQDY